MGEWVSRSPQEILSSRVGNCYDTVKLQDYLLDAARVEHRMFLLVPRQSLEENRGDLPAHLFMLQRRQRRVALGGGFVATVRGQFLGW